MPPKTDARDRPVDKEAQQRKQAAALQASCDRAVETSRLGLTDETMQVGMAQDSLKLVQMFSKT
jgi:hypothetical protein